MTRNEIDQLASHLERLDAVNTRLEAANTKLANSNAKMVSAILHLTVVIDGLLTHVVGDNEEVVTQLQRCP